MQHRHFKDRHGVVLIVVIAVFAIVMTMAASWVRCVMLEHQTVRLHADRAQARWLAEAGVRRAAARLVVDGQYEGETWQIDAAELGGKFPAEVSIDLTPLVNEQGAYRLVATALCPAAGAPSARYTKTVRFSLHDRENVP